MAKPSERRAQRLYPLLGLVALGLCLLLFFVWAKGALQGALPKPAPPAQQCIVRVDEQSASLDLEQSASAAIIVAEAQRRGLPARAATIALATAMQESSLRNIDHGDRDSVGLFQQRPSQGWGTVDQIMDPWYASGKFYEHLVKVDGWQSGDINDIAQAVQRSGVPDGYRKHVENAKIWSSALTGHSPAAVSCIDRGTAAPRTGVSHTVLSKAFGASVKVGQGEARVTLTSSDPTKLWSATQLFMMTTGTTGVRAVSVGGQTWTADGQRAAAWQGTPTPKPTEATITLRG